MTNKKSAPCEYWIEGNIAYSEHVDGQDENAVHVIEYSAYRELEDKLQIVREALAEVIITSDDITAKKICSRALENIEEGDEET